MLRERDTWCRGSPTVLSAVIGVGASIMAASTILYAVDGHLPDSLRVTGAATNGVAAVLLAIVGTKTCRVRHCWRWPLFCVFVAQCATAGVLAASVDDDARVHAATRAQGAILTFYLLSCAAVVADTGQR